MDTLLYILQVNVFLIGFALIYMAFFRQTTHFKQNRFYLICSGLFALLIPLIEWPSFGGTTEFAFTLPEFLVGSEIATETTAASSWNWAWFIAGAYSLGFVVIGFQMLRGIWRVKKLQSLSESKRVNNVVMVKTTGDWPTFSFFNLLFLNTSDDEAEKDKIVQHELVHIQQRHSLDLLFFELIRLVFWFNPMCWWYKKAVSENHEFLADEAVLQQDTDKEKYSMLLISQTFGVTPAGLIHNFNNQSLLKRRIMMMNQKPSTPIAKLKYLLFVPLAAGMIWVSSCTKEAPEKDAVNPPAVETTTADAPDKEKGLKDYADLDVKPEFPGGKDAMMTFLIENMKYPKAAKEAGIEGKVMVRFDIDEEGKVSNVVALETLEGGLSEEAVRVISEMPNWTPGEKDGKKVSLQLSLPVMFKMQ